MERVTVEQLDKAMVAVWEADSAWANDLASAPAKTAYKAARAAYKTLADRAEDQGVLVECGRCGGAGGWAGWPGFTCFACGGTGKGPFRRAKFQAMPPTRAKKAIVEEARANERMAERAANYAAFKAAHPAEAALLDTIKTWDELEEHDEDGVEFDHFFAGLKDKVKQYGNLSEKQLACVTREIAKRAAAAAALPFPRGMATVSGEIVGTKDTEGYGGGRKYNMLVKLEGEYAGNTVMGSIPAKVYDAVSDEGKRVTAPLVGTKLTFTAQFEKGRDEHFGFYKSPKQIKVTHVEWEV